MELAWVVAMGTPDENGEQGASVLRKVCSVGGKGCALDLLAYSYMLVLPS
jgi:hypothetical protein